MLSTLMAKPTTSSISVERTAGFVRVRLTRPDRYNVLDRSVLQQLWRTLAPPTDSLPLLIEGDGGVFSLGVDIRELSAFDATTAAAYSRLGQRVMQRLEAWPGVTVVWLQGYALGPGLELAVGCDVLVAAPGLRLGLPGLAWALMPCLGGMRRLSSRLTAQTCGDLFLKGRMLDAHEALREGLVDRLAEEASEVERLATDLGEFGAGAVAAIRAVRLQRQGRINQRAEASLFSQPFASGECQRRLRSLLAS
jgi:enoyl-CoA hydratase